MISEADKKLEYLQRGEVRTMEKDLARLREQEAKIERERIAKLRAGEEAEEEKKKQELAEREAEERKRAGEEAKTRTEELERLREAALKEGEPRPEESGRERDEARAEEFKEVMRETQTKEEEERRKFLERVAAKAEGLKAEEAPAPPPPPAPSPLPLEPPKPLLPSFKIPKLRLPRIPKPPLPKISGVFPQKPSVLGTIWARVIVSLLIFAILALVATFWYWYLVVREQPLPPAPPVGEKPEVTRLFINEKILNFGYHIPVVSRVINTIIIHSVYNILSEDPYSIEDVIEEYKMYGVAAHYLITRDSIIYQTAPREAIAYHAGVGQMPDGRTNVNNFSIGIEVIYTKTEAPTEAQYLALAQLVEYLQQAYEIPAGNILGHKDIAPGRKDDPWNFDWEYFQSLIK